MESNIQTQGTQSSEEAVQVKLCLFVFSAMQTLVLVSTVICQLLLALLLSEQVSDLRSWQKVLRGCVLPEVERSIPCDAMCCAVYQAIGEVTSLESAIWPLQALLQAALLSSNTQHWKIQHKKTILSGCIKRESWQQLSHGMMWRLNQLSSAVHTVFTWSLQHCSNLRPSHWGWHTEFVMAAYAWQEGLLSEITIKQQWVCVCVYAIERIKGVTAVFPLCGGKQEQKFYVNDTMHIMSLWRQFTFHPHLASQLASVIHSSRCILREEIHITNPQPYYIYSTSPVTACEGLL